MFFLRKAKVCIFPCLFADCCVCVSVWEWVYSQVLADILGLCGCGWWLAFCADNREGTASFFLYFYLLVCVCEYNMNINSILYLFQTDELFVTRLGGLVSATVLLQCIRVYPHLVQYALCVWTLWAFILQFHTCLCECVQHAPASSVLHSCCHFQYSYKARQGKFIRRWHLIQKGSRSCT